MFSFQSKPPVVSRFFFLKKIVASLFSIEFRKVHLAQRDGERRKKWNSCRFPPQIFAKLKWSLSCKSNFAKLRCYLLRSRICQVAQKGNPKMDLYLGCKVTSPRFVHRKCTNPSCSVWSTVLNEAPANKASISRPFFGRKISAPETSCYKMSLY